MIWDFTTEPSKPFSLALAKAVFTNTKLMLFALSLPGKTPSSPQALAAAKPFAIKFRFWTTWLAIHRPDFAP